MVLKSTGVIKKLAVSTAVAGMVLSAPVFANGASASTINVHQLITVGEQGHAVTVLQKRLDSLNYYGYAIDGIYGPITSSAVRKYQRANGLSVDGIAGPVTLGSLFSSNSTANVSVHTESINTSQLLQIGDRGSAVRNLQSELDSLNFYSGALDGIYGPNTAGAVRDFQRTNGLAVDGIAGPATLGALAGNPESASVVKSASTSGSEHSSSNVVSAARSLLGTPHSVLDCSAFINRVYSEVGVNLPRTANGMWYNAGSRVSSPSVGDLVFFEDTYSTSRTATHVGVYIGGGQMISSTSSSGVAITPYNTGYWGNHYLGSKSVS